MNKDQDKSPSILKKQPDTKSKQKGKITFKLHLRYTHPDSGNDLDILIRPINQKPPNASQFKQTMEQIDSGDYFIDPVLMKTQQVGVVVIKKEAINQMGKYWVQEVFENEQIVSHYNLAAIFDEIKTKMSE